MVNAKIQSEPELRFPEFVGEWRERSMDFLLHRASEVIDLAPDEDYREIGVRSHGRGVFHKEVVKGRALGDKRVFRVMPNALVLNIVFAWEQALAITTERERGFIASHRFPMFVEREERSYLPFILELLLTKRGKALLELASPGGAGRNKTLGQQEFLKLEVWVPERPEQVKIGNFLGAVDQKLNCLRKKRDLLIDYKHGVIQQLFADKLRFKRDDGNAFPDWEQQRLGDVLTEHRLKSTGTEAVFSVSVHKGLVNQVEHLGRSFSAKDTSNYNRVHPGDVVYTKSPTGDFPLGIVKQSKLSTAVIVSPLYGVFTPETVWLGSILDAYFAASTNVTNYLKPITQKGAKNTINVTNAGFLSGILRLPVDHDEQRKIADFLSTLDLKIEAVKTQIAQIEAFKTGLSQQMFV